MNNDFCSFERYNFVIKLFSIPALITFLYFHLSVFSKPKEYFAEPTEKNKEWLAIKKDSLQNPITSEVFSMSQNF